MTDLGAWILLIGRVLIGGYLAAGPGRFHMSKGPMATGYAQQMKFPVPALAGWPSGLWLIGAGISVAFGIWPDVGALMLAAFVIPAGWWFHRFWEVEDPTQKQFQSLLFGRNLVFLGAGVALFAFFASFGHGLALTITDPLFDLRP